jgi:VWFA-related protein
MERIVKGTVFLVALILVAYSASGQSAPEGQEASISTIRSTSNLVIVPALVRTASGELLTNRGADDFRLTDNGVEQKIFAEEMKSEPTATVVIMQTGGAAPRQFQNYRTLNTMLTFMMGSSDRKAALVTFDSRLEQIWNFPPRTDGLKHAFKNPEDGDHGAAILDALNCGIGLLEHQPASFRRVILLLSQTRDEGSKTSAEQVLQRLGESNTTIYSITFPSEKSSLKQNAMAPGGIDPPDSVSPTFTPLDVALKAMRKDTAAEAAVLSGGEHVKLKNQEDLERTLSILAHDFANSYTLSFHPNSHEPGFHAIQIQVLKKLARHSIEARTIYWNRGTDADE